MRHVTHVRSLSGRVIRGPGREERAKERECVGWKLKEEERFLLPLSLSLPEKNWAGLSSMFIFFTHSQQGRNESEITRSVKTNRINMNG